MPIDDAQVTLFESGSSTPLGQTTSDGNGHFSIDPSTTTTSGIFFATASVREGVVLMAIIGPVLPESITINELTTVAACYAAAQFLENGTIGGDSFALSIVAGMNANLVNVGDGTSSPVLTNPPNASQTNALGSTRSLANALASCVRSTNEPKVLADFFKLATPPGGAAPADKITAMVNIAKTPANNAGGIFLQSKLVQCYQPPVQHQPDAWTIVVKVNDSGDDANMFGGPGSLAFDSQGRAWIPNNVKQGTNCSTAYSIVLDKVGRPAVDSSGKRMSPFTGGGLLGPGFGVGIGRHDGEEHVWIGDFGWNKECWPTGSVSRFDLNAKPLSPPEGFQGGVHRVQGTVVDDDGNVWLASYGNHRVVVYPRGDAQASRWYPEVPDPEFTPFAIAIASDGTAWVTNSNPQKSSIVHLRFTGSGFEKLHETKIGKTLKGIVIDSSGTIWVCSGGDDHVYAFDRDGVLLGGYQGGGTNGPWGLNLNGDGDVWVGNFGPLEVGSVFHGRLTHLAGWTEKTRQFGRLPGDGVSPQTGYTLPTAGSPVTLHNGDPLYGPGAPDCFIPMMRTTGVNVDAAGNVWTCNNWKPNFDVDAFGDPLTDTAANPGGDGMLIWVGLAKPVRR